MKHQSRPRDARADCSPTYAAYISSYAWRANPARLEELEAAGFRCRICNRSADEVRLEVHHRTYQNFGRELATDLTTLCVDCHIGNTDMLRRRRYAAFEPVFADASSAEQSVPLFDPMSTGDSS
jgi:5-methylcytosine-specific restriction endonuclease McrA